MGVKEPFPVLFFFFPLHVDPQLRHFPFINELFPFFFPIRQQFIAMQIQHICKWCVQIFMARLEGCIRKTSNIDKRKWDGRRKETGELGCGG